MLRHIWIRHLIALFSGFKWKEYSLLYLLHHSSRSLVNVKDKPITSSMSPFFIETNFPAIFKIALVRLRCVVSIFSTAMLCNLHWPDHRSGCDSLVIHYSLKSAWLNTISTRRKYYLLPFFFTFSLQDLQRKTMWWRAVVLYRWRIQNNFLHLVHLSPSL